MPTDREKGGRLLALVPLSAGALLFALLMPRAVPPDTFPVPAVNLGELERVVAEDRRLADTVSREELPFEVRSLGSALRDFNAMQIDPDATPERINKARLTIDESRSPAIRAGVEALRRLRAFQLETFLRELEAYERDGVISPELVAVGGRFVDTTIEVGWTKNGRVLLTQPERRVAFKKAWNETTQTDRIPGLRLGVDEMRVLYALYLTRPHPGEGDRATLADFRRSAKTPQECDQIRERERRAVEQWRADKLRRMVDEAVDPEYPTEFAFGVAQYRVGNYEGAAESFRRYLETHRAGAWTLRARNHLRACLVAAP